MVTGEETRGRSSEAVVTGEETRGRSSEAVVTGEETRGRSSDPFAQTVAWESLAISACTMAS